MHIWRSELQSSHGEAVVSPVTITIGSASPANIPLTTPHTRLQSSLLPGHFRLPNREVVVSLTNKYGGTLWQCTGLGLVGLGIVILELKSGEDVGGYKHKLEAQLLLNWLIYKI